MTQNQREWTAIGLCTFVILLFFASLGISVVAVVVAWSQPALTKQQLWLEHPILFGSPGVLALIAIALIGVIRKIEGS